jgi:polyisoprenoid-binding protein YceI
MSMFRNVNSFWVTSLWLIIYIISQAGAQHWNLQPVQSSVNFKIKNAGLWVNGSLQGLTASLHFEPNNLAMASISGSVQVKTLDTGIGLRNKHLRSDDYFHEAKFPLIQFAATSISKEGNFYKAKGKLTIKDISKPVDIPFTFEEKGKTGVFKAEFSLNRRDYGVGGNSWTLSDEVFISIILTAEQANMSSLH